MAIYRYQHGGAEHFLVGSDCFAVDIDLEKMALKRKKLGIYIEMKTF